MLATSPEIDTFSEFVERRVYCLRARSGRSLSDVEDHAEKRAIGRELEAVLAGRYARHLGSWSGASRLSHQDHLGIREV